MTKPIGTESYQIPTNGDLGTLAYQDAESPVLGAIASQITSTSNKRPSIILDFANSRYMPPQVTFWRKSGGTFINKAGRLEYVGPGTPRFNHNIVTGECEGLLMEPTAVNYQPYGNLQTLNGSANVTITSGVTGVDGKTSAIRVQYNASGNSWVQPSMTNITSAGTYTVSVWIRRIQGLPSNSSFMYQGAGVSAVAGSETQMTPENFPIGQWRRWKGQYVLGVNSSTNFVLPGYDAGAGVIVEYSCLQIEAGDVATSYIPTTGAVATRQYDYCWVSSMNPYDSTSLGNALPSSSLDTFDWFNEAEGTWYADAYTNQTSSDPMIVEGGTYADGAGAFNVYSLTFAISASSTIQWINRKLSSDNDLRSEVGYVTPGRRIKMCATYTSTTVGEEQTLLAYDGNLKKVSSGNQPASSSAALKHFIGCRSGSNSLILNGCIRKLAYYPTALSSDEIVEMTK